MELTIEEVAQLLGVKELENFQLRKKVAELEAKYDELLNHERGGPLDPPETI